MESPLGELILRLRHVTVSRQCFQEIDADTRRRAKARSRGNLRCKKEVRGDVMSKFFENRQGDLERIASNVHLRNVLPGFNNAEVCGDNLNLSVRSLFQHGIKVFVNGRTENRASEPFVIRGKIRSTTPEAYPDWATYD